MSRARDLSKLGNINVLTADDVSSEVGIATTVPRSTLDVRGEIKVGTAIQAGTAGVLTATSFSGGLSGDITGTACTFTTGTFNGNVTIGGTLTYEDVTNIDSLGIVTARAGVNVSGGQLAVGVAYSVGAAGVATAAGFVGPLTGNADTATTATTATNVTVTANNSTDETVYPIFVDGATGSQGAESDTGLTYNPSDGNLTSTTFTGAVTGNVTGTASNASGATGDFSIADKIVHTGDTNTAIRFSGADTITAETGGSERIRIDSAGLVGINTTTLTEQLEVDGDIRVRNQVKYRDPNGDETGSIGMGDDDNFSIQSFGTSGHITFDTGSSAYERARILSSGRVAIGTDAADAKLEISTGIIGGSGGTGEEVLLKLQGRATKNVYLDINADADRRGIIRFKSAGTDKWSIGRGDSDELSDSSFMIATGSSGGNTHKLVITSGGLVGIGQDVPVAKLHINGSDASAPCLVMPDPTNERYSVGFGNINIGGVGQRLDFYAGDSGGNTTNLGSGARRMVLTAQGRLGIGLTNPAHQFVIGGETNGDMQVTSSDANTGESRLFIGGSEQNQKKCAIIFDPDGSGYCRGTLKFCMDGGADLSDVDTSGDHPRMVINRDGEVGVGTDNPASKFVVAANSASAQVELKRTNTNTTGAIGAINWTAMDGHSCANINALGDGDNEGAHIVFKTTTAAAESNPYGSGTIERVRITSVGDINLGATGTYNDITGTGGGLLIGPGEGKNAGIVLRSDSDGFGRIYFGDNSGSAAQRHDGYIVYSQTDRNFSVGTATTTRITVGSAGQIGVAGANYGSSGQVLTSSGAGSAPTWNDASGGAWEFVSSIENPNTSTVAFTGLSTSNTAAYKVVWNGANINSSNQRVMRCRIYLDGTLKTGSEYQDMSMFVELGSGTVNGSQGARDAINLSGQLQGSRGYNGELTFPFKQRESGGAESLQAFYGFCVSQSYANTIRGFHNSSYSSVLTGIAFDSPDNYNVTDGQFYLYRLTRS